MILQALARRLSVQPVELAASLLAFGYFFCLLAGYYLLRPVRDAMGVAAGLENMPWLFTVTFLAMLAVTPLFGWLSSRLPRHRLIPATYAFFILNLLLFRMLFVEEGTARWVAGSFFVWLSVFNLFVISVFWSLMADIFSSAQAKRLFPVIAAGGSCGAVAGPALADGLTPLLGIPNLLLVAVGLLGLATLAAAWLGRHPSHPDHAAGGEPMGGSILAGARLALGSRYLLGVCAFLWIYTTLSTVLYFEQAHIVAEAFAGTEERTRVFARIDLAVNVLTLLLQLVVTARIIRRFGLGPTLALIPALLAAGFLLLAASPELWILIAVQILRRAGNYAVTRPAREVLFTVLGREAKYKAKNFIDTVIYRGGDALAGWAFAALKALGLGLGGIALSVVPLALLWAWLGLRLGAEQARREENP